MGGTVVEWIARVPLALPVSWGKHWQSQWHSAKDKKTVVSSFGQSVSHRPFSFRDFALSRFRDPIPFVGVVPPLATPLVPQGVPPVRD
jgi:hypothetical protein